MIWGKTHRVTNARVAAGVLLGGPSLDHFDMLSAIVNWVEKGNTPDSVIATGPAFPGRTRPLCAYPKHAQYVGHGDTENASNFRCE